MPLGGNHHCSACKTTVSCMWRKNKKKSLVCNSCFIKNGNDDCQNTNGNSNGNGKGNGSKSSRDNGKKSGKNAKRLRYKQAVNSTKVQATKGKNRRIIFKKNPMKSAESVATVVTSGSVFHGGTYYQLGDIVSVVDEEGGIFYAQLRGFLQDQYSHKSAIITWLLPTQATDKNKFDPATYILGPDEELPRSLELMEFVCHLPSDYYRFIKTPYPVVPVKENSGFMWSSVLPTKHVSTQSVFQGSSSPTS